MTDNTQQPSYCGQHFIGGKLSGEGKASFQGFDPAKSEYLPGTFLEATPAEIDAAAKAAFNSFDDYRSLPVETRAKFLDGIAAEIEILGDRLIERTMQETGLARPRVENERNRAVSQLRLFASVVRDGSWAAPRIDHANPDRKPLPKPDVRRVLIPVGPVAVFGASNFPLAISVVGNDTVAAFAAGCTVVVKAHPGHPGTCELLAGAVVKAARSSGVPDGVFSMVHGKGNEVGQALVKHPLIRAVGFTGSLQGGRALFAAVNSRPVPIPIFAEMGSVNPVFLLPGALQARSEQIGKGFVSSMSVSCGQLCTQPGLAIGVKSPEFSNFLGVAKSAIQEVAPQTLLHPGIYQAYGTGRDRIAAQPEVTLFGKSSAAPDKVKHQAEALLFEVSAKKFMENPVLHEEVFGPLSVIVQCEANSDLEKIAESLDGSLTATLHGTPDDLRANRRLIQILERKVGRIIFNGYPTGVEVCHAMNHGGPYPATFDGQSTSIGTASIFRFARPVCYQDFPDDVLPETLQESNPAKVWRLVDGEFKN